MLALYVSGILVTLAALSLTTAAEEGTISARKVGGLYFLKAGRFGASFYVSKGGK